MLQFSLKGVCNGERNEEGEFKIFSKALACFLYKGWDERIK